MKRLVLILAAMLAAAAGLAGTIAEVTADKVGSQVTLSGEVTEFRASRSERAPSSFTLKDATGSIRVAIWPDVFNSIAGKDAIKVGAKVSVTGEAASFRDKVEIHPKAAGDVKVEGAPASAAAPTATAAATAAPKTAAAPVTAASPAGVSPIASLTKEKVGSEFTVAGTVTNVRKPRTETAPWVIKVKDESGSVDVVFWSDTANALPETKKAVNGDQVRIKGKLDEYRGSLQIKLGGADDLKTQKSDPGLFKEAAKPGAPQASVPAQKVPLARVGDIAAGTAVKVSGKVEAVQPIRLGRRVTLGDASGRAGLIIWDTADGIRPEIRDIKPSSTIQVAGRVNLAEGQPVVVVSKAAEVLAVTP